MDGLARMPDEKAASAPSLFGQRLEPLYEVGIAMIVGPRPLCPRPQDNLYRFAVRFEGKTELADGLDRIGRQAATHAASLLAIKDTWDSKDGTISLSNIVWHSGKPGYEIQLRAPLLLPQKLLGFSESF